MGLRAVGTSWKTSTGSGAGVGGGDGPRGEIAQVKGHAFNLGHVASLKNEAQRGKHLAQTL